MIIISAMSKDRVIGNGDGMPWNVPDEYEQYLGFVGGNTVIMGRKTFEIFGKDLPATTDVVVITRQSQITGVKVASSFPEAVTIAASLGKPVFVAGGASVYEQALPLAEEMYLSTIKGEFEGDAWFPEFDPDQWELIEQRDERDYVFRIYRRLNIAA